MENQNYYTKEPGLIWLWPGQLSLILELFCYVTIEINEIIYLMHSMLHIDPTNYVCCLVVDGNKGADF